MTEMSDQHNRMRPLAGNDRTESRSEPEHGRAGGMDLFLSMFDQLPGLLKDAGIFMFRIGADGRFAAITGSDENSSMAPLKALIGTPFIQAVHPEDRDRLWKSFSAHPAHQPLIEECRVMLPGGYVRWVRVLTRRETPAGARADICGIAIDVHRRKVYEEELRKQKKRLESLVTHASLGIVQVDRDKRILSCNHMFERLFQYPAAEILGRDLDRLVSPEDGYRTACMYSSLILDGQAVQTIGRRKRRDGTEVDVEIHGVPVTIDGVVVGVYALYNDITALVTAQQALAEKEELYRTFVESSPDGIMIIHEGVIVEINPAMEVIFAAGREELINQPPHRLSPALQSNGKSSKDEAERLIRLALDGQPQFFEWVHQRRDGTPFFADVTLNRMEMGDRSHIQGRLRDVTERKRTERALRESEEKYRTILEITEDGYYEVNLRGDFLFVNDAFCHTMGYAREELIGVSYQRFSDPEVAKNVLRDFQQAFAAEVPVKNLEWQVCRKDGTQRDLEVSIALMYDAAGRKRGFRGLTRDITARKRTEQALIRSEEKYKHLYDNAQVGMFRARVRDGRILEVNTVALRLFGYASRREIPREKNAIHHFLDQGFITRLFEELHLSGRVDSLITTFHRRDGTGFSAEFSARIFPELGYIEGSILDITARQQAEEALRNPKGNTANSSTASAT